MGVPALKLENVCFGYPKHSSLEDKPFSIESVSLEIEVGGYLSILGPSGSGKTTLLNLIGGFFRPRSGRIWVGNRDVTRLAPGSRGIMTVFQKPALFPHLKVWENVAFGLMARGVKSGEARRSAEKMLSDVRLPPDEHSTKFPHQLSGGQEHRVALARVLIMKPKVVLLDEPLAAMDDPLREGIEDILIQLKRQNDTTFVEVTHNQEHALAISSHIALMDYGKILEVSTPQEVWFRPRTAFPARFLGGANIIDGHLERCPKRGWIFKAKDGGLESWIEVPWRSIEPEKGASLILRPESISFNPLPRHDNSCEVTVLERAFRGGHIDYHVAAKNTYLTLRCLAPETQEAIKGTSKMIWWSSLDVWLLCAQKEEEVTNDRAEKDKR